MASTASYKLVVLAAQGTAPQEELGPGQPRLSWNGSVWPLEEPAGLGPQQEGPGTRGMLCGVHSFPHLHPELSCTSLKTFIVSNNKSQPCGSTGSPERAGCWHPGLAAPAGPLHQPPPCSPGQQQGRACTGGRVRRGARVILQSKEHIYNCL